MTNSWSSSTVRFISKKNTLVDTKQIRKNSEWNSKSTRSTWTSICTPRMYFTLLLIDGVLESTYSKYIHSYALVFMRSWWLTCLVYPWFGYFENRDKQVESFLTWNFRQSNCDLTWLDSNKKSCSNVTQDSGTANLVEM